jgi:hypothetical protein
VSCVLCEKIRIRRTCCHTGGRRIVSKQCTIVRTVGHADSQQKICPLSWRTLIHAGRWRIVSKATRWALGQASLICDRCIKISRTGIKTGIICGIWKGIAERRASGKTSSCECIGPAGIWICRTNIRTDRHTGPCHILCIKPRRTLSYTFVTITIQIWIFRACLDASLRGGVSIGIGRIYTRSDTSLGLIVTEKSL